MKSLKSAVKFLRSTRAVSALEYAILVGVIAVAIGLALTTFSASLTKAIKTIGDKVGGTTMTQTPAVN